MPHQRSDQLASFSVWLKQKRHERGLSQRALVGLLASHSAVFKRLDVMTLSRWERGIALPSRKRLISLCEVFEIDPLLLMQSWQKQKPINSRDFSLRAVESASRHSIACRQPYADHARQNWQAEPLTPQLFARYAWQIDNFQRRWPGQRLPSGLLKEALQVNKASGLLFREGEVLCGHMIGLNISAEAMEKPFVDWDPCLLTLDHLQPRETHFLAISSYAGTVPLLHRIFESIVHRFLDNNDLERFGIYMYRGAAALRMEEAGYRRIGTKVYTNLLTGQEQRRYAMVIDRDSMLMSHQAIELMLQVYAEQQGLE